MKKQQQQGYRQLRFKFFLKKKTRRSLHRSTENNCQGSPAPVVRRRIHEFPSAYDHSTQCWAYTQCTRTQNSPVVKSANSFAFIPREKSRYALDAFQLTCCSQLTRFSTGHFSTVNLEIKLRERHLCLDHQHRQETHRSARATAETETTETEEGSTNNKTS